MFGALVTVLHWEVNGKIKLLVENQCQFSRHTLNHATRPQSPLIICGHETVAEDYYGTWCEGEDEKVKRELFPPTHHPFALPLTALLSLILIEDWEYDWEWVSLTMSLNLIRQPPSCLSRVLKCTAFLSFARSVWRTPGRLCMNRERSLFRMCCSLLDWDTLLNPGLMAVW